MRHRNRKSQNEAGMSTGINEIKNRCGGTRRASGPRVWEYLYGAPVLVLAALPWLGPEREGRKGLPYGAADEGTGWRCLLCVCPGPDHRGSHTSQKGATCAPPRGSVNGFRERSENVGG